MLNAHLDENLDSATRKLSFVEKSVNWICEITPPNKYHLITMIFCDFGVLSNEARKKLTLDVYNSLLPSGIFLFDVFTPLKYAKEKIGKYVRMDSGIKIYIYYYMLFIVMKKIIHF